MPLVKQTMLRSSGFGGCWDMKSAHQSSLLNQIKMDYTNISELNLQLAFEDFLSPEPAEQKNKFILLLLLVQSSINTSNGSAVSTYLCPACITSTSCINTMSTPHLVPRSTNSELKESMMTMVLRTGVWPFSRVCSSVSALV